MPIYTPGYSYAIKIQHLSQEHKLQTWWQDWARAYDHWINYTNQTTSPTQKDEAVRAAMRAAVRAAVRVTLQAF